MSPNVKQRPSPYVRPHDSWQCTSSGADNCGGSGHHEPVTPCIPKPNLRYHRGICAGSLTALIVGFLMIMFSSPNRNEFLAPGPLTSHHAQILAEQGSARCATCHGAGDQTLSSWLADAISSGKHIPVSQSQLCLDCHNQNLMSEFAMHAHNLDPAILDKITQFTPVAKLGLGLLSIDSAGQMACSACHREHHGADFNLSAMSDQQCQACHSRQFHSFADGHPEFKNWPFQRRTAIAFDHVTHARKHFAERGKSFDCRKCHIDDATGTVKLVAPFSDSCAECHTEQIVHGPRNHLPVFSLPMMDIDAISSSGRSIGQWPESAQGDFDGELPPIMKLLLSADREAARILDRRGPNFQFSDLDPEQPSDIEDAATLAWCIKRLLSDLAGQPDGFARRVAQALDGDVSRAQLDYLALGISTTMFADAGRLWIPQLAAEMNRRQSDAERGVQISPPNDILGRPLWVQDEDGLLAENPLSAVYGGPLNAPVDSAAPLPGVAPDANAPTAPPDEGAAGNHSETLPKIVTQQAMPLDRSKNQITNSHVRNPSANDNLGPGVSAGNDEGLLSSNPLQSLLSNSQPNIPRPPSAVAEQVPPPATSINSGNVATYLTKLANADIHGWYRDDRSLSISYRLIGHADPLLKHWNDLAAMRHDHDAIRRSGLFDLLNDPASVGSCRSCHTTDQLESGRRIVNWQPDYRPAHIKSFTRFAHRPHDIQTSLQDCTTCHRLGEHLSNAHQFTGYDASDFQSNFIMMSKNDCAQCHRSGGARDGCVDCHHYHVDKRSLEPRSLPRQVPTRVNPK